VDKKYMTLILCILLFFTLLIVQGVQWQPSNTTSPLHAWRDWSFPSFTPSFLSSSTGVVNHDHVTKDEEGREYVAPKVDKQGDVVDLQKAFAIPDICMDSRVHDYLMQPFLMLVCLWSSLRVLKYTLQKNKI